MSIFKPSQKTFSPLVNDNDNEQGPSMNRGHQRGGGGGGGRGGGGAGGGGGGGERNW